jgi:phosphoglycerate dehydrogenase-like enzyme
MNHVSQNDLVIQTEHLSDGAATWLGARCRLLHCAQETPEFFNLLKSASALIVRTYTIVNESMLAQAPQLKVVGRAGVGIDNIDVSACRRRGIEVVYTPDANTQAVVEYVVCLLCDALRPRLTLDRAISIEDWNQRRAETVGQRQMNQLTLGVLGFGRVGRGLAGVAQAIGYRVFYNDLLEIPINQRASASPLQATELFEQCDVISIHIDGRAGNRAFVNQRLISRMKPNAILLNTSRGFVVDNLALKEFLLHNPAALAMLDVHEPEPFGPDYPLLGLRNAKLYPHLASRTETAMNNMSWVVRDVVAVLEGRPPEFPAP